MSVTGKNIRHILNETGQTDIFKVKVSEMKKSVKFCEVQGEDKWKPDMIKELTNVKKGSMFLEGEHEGSLLTNEEIPLTPMGVLAPVFAQRDTPISPPSTSAEIFRRTCLQSSLKKNLKIRGGS